MGREVGAEPGVLVVAVVGCVRIPSDGVPRRGDCIPLDGVGILASAPPAFAPFLPVDGCSHLGNPGVDRKLAPRDAVAVVVVGRVVAVEGAEFVEARIAVVGVAGR